jgi:hypothetical protein
MKKITLKNIKQFLEGNIQMHLDGLGLQPEYYKEQIAYRMLTCQDCLKKNKCHYCGCDVPGKLYVKESCNDGKRFPNLMNENDWNEYKKRNKIL